MLAKFHEDAKATFTCGQLERGENGTDHIQFYINLPQPQRLSALKKVCPHSHWEVVRVNKAAQQYVMKEDTRIAGPWEFGERPKVNQNSDSVQKSIEKRKELN